MKDMNVKELMEHCKIAIANGHGNKEVWLSNDEEGNGFHELYFAFSPNVEENDCYGQGLKNDKDIILG